MPAPLKNSCHIVLIEDDSELARLTGVLLETEGYKVSACQRGDLAVDFIRKAGADLVILDIMLPGKNGIEVCSEIRHFYAGPVLMLTGRDDDITEASSFNQGADDYVLKPIRPHVFLARIAALLRRRAGASKSTPDPVILGDMEVSVKRRTVSCGQTVIDLTSSEFDVLSLLLQHVGEIVSREQCCEQLRGFSYDGMDRSIDMRISSLRKKLGNTPEDTQRIKTVRGRGYMLVGE